MNGRRKWRKKWKLPPCPGCKHHQSAHSWTPVPGGLPMDSIHGPCVVPGCDCKVYVDVRDNKEKPYSGPLQDS